jgi:hypothetical protein
MIQAAARVAVLACDLSAIDFVSLARLRRSTL